MKKILIILVSLLFLEGCSSSTTENGKNPWEPPAQNQAVSQTAPTQPGTLDIKSQWVPVQPPPVISPVIPSLATNQTPVPPPVAPAGQQPARPTPVPPGQKVKVALLVPLSGSNAEIGESLSNAAQMALFDTGADGFELIPRDTHGTAAGAAAAAQSAVHDGAQLILGPLLAEEVRAAAPIAQSANINMVAFTTDWKQAGPNTFVMGFVPFGQVQRVLSYAASKGIHTIGVVAPQTDYGNAVMSAYTAETQALGQRTLDVLRMRSGDPALSTSIQKFSHSALRKRSDGTMTLPPFDAVFLPVGGTDAQTVGNLLTYYDLDPKTVRRLGTGLWDDAVITHDTNLEGGWFAAPDPSARKIFEQKYRDTYGAMPSRLASLGYDATALASVLAKTGQIRQGLPAFDHAALTNTNGFSGIDGIFRFRQDGLAERGLAVLEIRGGQSVVIDPAPRSFQNSAQ